jgi:hypothetical protein
LKWLSDIDQLIYRFPFMDWRWLMAESRRLGTRRMVLMSLNLAQLLLGTVLPERVKESVVADPAVDRLSALAGRQLVSRQQPVITNGEKRRFFLLMRERFRDRARYTYHNRLGRLAPRNGDHDELTRLSGWRFYLHYVRWALRAAWRFGWRSLKKPDGGVGFV